jgi:hypothetical protein
VSLTVTWKLHDASGLDPLEAVQSTVVVPTGNTCGEVIVVDPILQVVVGAGNPVAVVLNDTVAEHCPVSAFTVMSDGHVMAAAWVMLIFAVTVAWSTVASALHLTPLDPPRVLVHRKKV